MWLTYAKALLLLSHCHKTDDQFWFSFFHAAGHTFARQQGVVPGIVDQFKRKTCYADC